MLQRSAQLLLTAENELFEGGELQDEEVHRVWRTWQPGYGPDFRTPWVVYGTENPILMVYGTTQHPSPSSRVVAELTRDAHGTCRGCSESFPVD